PEYERIDHQLRHGAASFDLIDAGFFSERARIGCTQSACTVATSSLGDIGFLDENFLAACPLDQHAFDSHVVTFERHRAERTIESLADDLLESALDVLAGGSAGVLHRMS